MSDHSPAQLELIRRYARTLRTMHADAMAARPHRQQDREGRIVRARPPREPVTPVGGSGASRSAPTT